MGHAGKEESSISSNMGYVRRKFCTVGLVIETQEMDMFFFCL